MSLIAILLITGLFSVQSGRVSAQEMACSPGGTPVSAGADQLGQARMGMYGFAPGSSVEVTRTGGDGTTQMAASIADDQCFAIDPTTPSAGSGQYSLEWRGV